MTTKPDTQYRNEIIEMLKALCKPIGEPYDGQFWTLTTDELIAFAKLVADVAAAKEREACAKICETLLGPTATDFYGKSYAAAIRSRGEK